MISITFEVNFQVKAVTRQGEVVCITGDCEQLGKWDPHKAIVMTPESGSTDSKTLDSDEAGSREGNVWSKKVQLRGQKEYNYRYFICKIIESDNEESERHVMVRCWETNIEPRKLLAQDFFSAEKSVPSEVATFGTYGGKSHITDGWLTDQSEIHIQLYNNPITMWNPHYRSDTFSIKCTALDHRYSMEMDDRMEEDYENDTIPTSSSATVLVSVLEDGKAKPFIQDQFGTIYPKNGFMSFQAQTIHPEYVGFDLSFFAVDAADTSGTAKNFKLIGSACILPLDHKVTCDKKKIPIIGLKNKPIGQLEYDFLLVKPLVGVNFDMSVSYQQYWKTTRASLDVGHRGMGNSYSTKKLASLRENTLCSLNTAGKHGADYVEFDVQLSKDQIPVIYHDFEVCITYRKKKKDDLQLLTLPIHELKLSELQSMKLTHPSSQVSEQLHDIMHSDDLDPEELQPFPTFQKLFEAVDEHIGFNVEVKYPQLNIKGEHEMPNVLEINQYIDKILKVVFQYAGARRIIFSCFHADACILLRKKQNKYPVLFLTNCDHPRYDPYLDLRARTVEMSKNFVVSMGLLGIDIFADILLKDMSYIKKIKDAGLVLFCWGEENNDSNVINTLRQHKVDGIIYDRINDFSSKKENIFLLEKKGKLEKLQKLQMASTSPETCDAMTMTDSGTSIETDPESS
ncbi:hypothetical protein ACJMK2_040200 [Sinanodonta woodiana]|uniref:Glycerophosphocholine phosphodiesterase GPCPD1 n=1 Tax=Sinanodonta woodiana TaxID=1069815 RepID=A0ABD3WFB0_SINWO